MGIKRVTALQKAAAACSLAIMLGSSLAARAQLAEEIPVPEAPLASAVKSQEKPELELWQLRGLSRAFDDLDPDVQIGAMRRFKSFALPKDVQVSRELLQEARKLATQIARLLDEQHPYVRRDAADALARMGDAAKDAVPKLANLLGDQDPGVRRSAADALGSMGEAAKDAVRELVNLLDDQEPAVRRSAADALGSIGEAAKHAVPQLIKLLRDERWQVGRSAALALGGIGEAASGAVGELVKLLEDRDSDLRSAAADALVRIGEAAKDAARQIAKGLDDQDPNVRCYIASVLGRMGDEAKEALPELIKLLEDQDSHVTRCAALAVRRMGEAGEDAVPQIARLLQHEKSYVRRYAAIALATMGAAAEEAVPQLVKLLEDENADVRRSALDALRSLGEAAKGAVPQLVTLLQHQDWGVRSSAADILGSIGEPAKGAVPQLATLLEDEDPETKRDIPYVLGRMGHVAEEAVPQLVRLLKDQDPQVRRAAAHALGRIGAAAKDAVPELVKLLEDQDASVRSSAATALGNMGEPAKDGVPQLVRLLKDQDSQARRAAAHALGRMGEAAKEGVPQLVGLLEDQDVSVRSSAAAALVNMGESAKDALPQIARLVAHRDRQVRQSATVALSRMGEAPKVIVPQIVELLGDPHPDVRVGAASVLIYCGPHDVKVVVEVLNEALRHAERNAEWRILAFMVAGDEVLVNGEPVGDIVHYLGNRDRKYVREIPQELNDRNTLLGGLGDAWDKTTQQHQDLREDIAKRVSEIVRAGGWREDHLEVLEMWRSTLEGGGFPDQANSIADVITPMITPSWLERAIAYCNDQKWPWAVGAYTALFLFWWAVLLGYPRGILLVNGLLRGLPEGKIKWPLEMTLSLRHFLLVGFFHYHRRVLDAWVRRRLQTARDNFGRVDTVRDRATHVALPVRLDGRLVPDFGAERLRPLLRRTPARLLIQGQGGAGKTSLACQLGKWAMAAQKSKRLTRHPMLPLLIEEELPKGGLTEAARGKLRELVGEADPIDREFFTQLLRKKRVIVIVDHLSEMGEETRKQIRPQEADFPVAALAVTSRIDEEALGVRATLHPILLKGNRVSSFVEAYLAQQNKAELFADDEEFFDDCRRLSRMVGEKEITVLLAKLYVDQLVKSKTEGTAASMPENVPDLMLRYVDELHPKGTELDVVRRAQNDARKVAWQCVKETFYPARADRDKVLKELGPDHPDKRLEYLESTLRIVRTEGAKYDQVRFTLDPVAEYLAGLEVVEMYKGHEGHWRSFLKRADEKPLEKIKGFLLAVRDCCLAAEANIPESVPDELAGRGGLDLELIEKNRRRLRVKQLIGDLKRPDASDREHAAYAVGEIGPEAKPAVPHLIEALKDEDASVREAVASALGKTGPEARGAVSALVDALKDGGSGVRQAAACAIGRIGPEAKGAVPALIEGLNDQNWHLRAAAAKALGGIGPEARAALPALNRRLRDGDEDVRLAVAQALTRIRREAEGDATTPPGA